MIYCSILSQEFKYLHTFQSPDAFRNIYLQSKVSPDKWREIFMKQPVDKSR